MACERHKDALSDVAAGGSAVPELEAHLASCVGCREQLEVLRRALALADDELGRLLSSEPSRRLLARIRAATAEPVAQSVWRLGWARPSLAAAAALLVALLVVVGRAPSREPSVVVERSPEPSGASPTSVSEGRSPAAEQAAPPPTAETPAQADAAPGRPSLAGLAAAAPAPEVLVPAGEAEALLRFAAAVRHRSVTPESLLVADLSLPLSQPKGMEIRPIEIVPLDPEEDSGAE